MSDERARVEFVEGVLRRLAAIADAFDENGLDEARPEWGDRTRDPSMIDLVAGRGGKTLLTLADALAAREALHQLSICSSPPLEPVLQGSAPTFVDLQGPAPVVVALVRALRAVMRAIDAQGARPDVEGSRTDEAREAVAALDTFLR